MSRKARVAALALAAVGTTVATGCTAATAGHVLPGRTAPHAYVQHLPVNGPMPDLTPPTTLTLVIDAASAEAMGARDWGSDDSLRWASGVLADAGCTDIIWDPATRAMTGEECDY